MKTRIIVALTAFLAVLGSLLVASPASAGTCTKSPWGAVCGVVYLDPHSATNVKAGSDWNGTRITGTTVTVAKGGSSKASLKDADAVFIPSGYCGQVGGYNFAGSNRWTKMHDGNLYLKVVKGSC